VNFGPKIGEQKHGFPLTSLIDLMFITLIYFMAASMYAQFESELSVQVPVSSAASPIQREPTEIIVNVTKDGKFIINRSERSLEEVNGMLLRIAELGGAHIIIRGDQETSWRDIFKVLDACKSANIWNVSFAAIKTEEGASQ
jgi:biopolymer transport protein ExbD